MEESERSWKWWPLFPLYPYGRKKTVCRELAKNQIWSLEQIQGLYYVAVPIRMTVIKVSDGLMIINPLPPTKELIKEIEKLSLLHGEVKSIVLPTASGLEHKIGLPALARIFDKADIWICPGQWSFPINLPLDFIGIPSKRTKILFENGTPYNEDFIWNSLGPINLGLGRFQEISCYHKPTSSLHVTDAIVGLDRTPPEIFNYDPTPLLFHSRDSGEELLIDSPEAREKGWLRLVLFSLFLKPNKLRIPSLKRILGNAFKKGLRTRKTHFGIYPFLWEEDWEESLLENLSIDGPKIQIAPVVKKLIFPRSKKTLTDWLGSIKEFKDMKYLISAHYSAPLDFTSKDAQKLIDLINSENWENNNANTKFLNDLYNKLSELKVIPEITEL